MALRLKKVKRWYLSLYDSNNDLIMYSDKRTLLHERRHRWQIRDNKGLIFMRMVADYALILSIACLIGNLRPLASVSFGYYIGFMILIEADAEWYSRTDGKRGLI